MALEKNVGGTDRAVRGVGGVGLLLLAVAGAATGRIALAGIVAIGAVALLFNAITQRCGINAVLGVDTCPTRDG